MPKYKISIQNQLHPTGDCSTSIHVNESLIWTSQRYKWVLPNEEDFDEEDFDEEDFEEFDFNLYIMNYKEYEWSYKNIHLTSHE